MLRRCHRRRLYFIVARGSALSRRGGHCRAARSSLFDNFFRLRILHFVFAAARCVALVSPTIHLLPSLLDSVPLPDYTSAGLLPIPLHCLLSACAGTVQLRCCRSLLQHEVSTPASSSARPRCVLDAPSCGRTILSLMCSSLSSCKMLTRWIAYFSRLCCSLCRMPAREQHRVPANASRLRWLELHLIQTSMQKEVVCLTRQDSLSSSDCSFPAQHAIRKPWRCGGQRWVCG